MNMREFQPPHCLLDAFGNRQGIPFLRLRQQHDKFFAAISRHQFAPATRDFRHLLCKGLQTGVTRQVSIIVVKLFEVIDVY